MNEEYLTARVSQICNIPYNFARQIVIDLEKRGLINHLRLNLDHMEDYIDIHNSYYRNYLTNSSGR